MIGEIIGQEISVNVSKNMKAQVIPQGNSYQATREGYNIFDYLGRISNNGILDFIVDKNTGYVTVNGTPSWNYATCVTSFNIDDILEDGETYSAWQEVYSNKVNGGMYIQLEVKSKDGKSSQWINSSTGKLNFTVDKTKYSYNVMIQCGTISDAGTFNNYKNRYMIYKGTDDKAFELYGASPSLDYPSEVEAVGDNINIFDKNVEVLDGYLSPDGSWNSSTTTGYTKSYQPIKPNTDYILSGLVLSSDDSRCSIYRLYIYDKDKNIIEKTSADIKTSEYTFTTPIKAAYIDYQVDKTTFNNNKDNIKLKESKKTISIVKSNKNLFNIPDYNISQGGLNVKVTNGNHVKITGSSTSGQTFFIMGANTNTEVLERLNKLALGKTITIQKNSIPNNSIEFNLAVPENAYFMQLFRTTVSKTALLSKEIVRFSIYVPPNTEWDWETDLQFEISNQATDIIEPKGDTYNLAIQKPFYKIGDYADSFIKQNGKWYEQHFIKELILTGEENWLKGSNLYPTYHIIVSDTINELSGEEELGLCNYFKIYKTVFGVDVVGLEFFNIYTSQFSFKINLGSGSEITTVEAWKAKVQELYNAGTPIKVYYVLATPKLIECTEEQTQILEQINNLYLYEGINYLYSTDDPSPIFQFSYDKIVNDFKFYLSENGRLIFPKENISFLCSISESTIPVMPEALETSAIIAGRDGDIPLETTYGPMSFELVLYTEDNLTPDEKLQQEQFLTKFCNSIKNNTETFALELAQKFYKIKYNGVLDRENYPKYLRVVFPFKSFNSYAYDVKNNTIYGNNKFESKTIESCGFKCIIKGPALKPILSLNDYSIEYTNTILEGESLIIDTNNSTVILVNSEGIETNAMRYYNHQFPKIQNGENELKVLSGIDNPENVSISWYDLTL